MSIMTIKTAVVEWLIAFKILASKMEMLSEFWICNSIQILSLKKKLF